MGAGGPADYVWGWGWGRATACGHAGRACQPHCKCTGRQHNAAHPCTLFGQLRCYATPRAGPCSLVPAFTAHVPCRCMPLPPCPPPTHTHTSSLSCPAPATEYNLTLAEASQAPGASSQPGGGGASASGGGLAAFLADAAAWANVTVDVILRLNRLSASGAGATEPTAGGSSSGVDGLGVTWLRVPINQGVWGAGWEGGRWWSMRGVAPQRAMQGHGSRGRCG